MLVPYHRRGVRGPEEPSRDIGRYIVCSACSEITERRIAEAPERTAGSCPKRGTGCYVRRTSTLQGSEQASFNSPGKRWTSEEAAHCSADDTSHEALPCRFEWIVGARQESGCRPYECSSNCPGSRTSQPDGTCPIDKVDGIAVRVSVEAGITTCETHWILRGPPPTVRLIVPRPEPHEARVSVVDPAGEPEGLEPGRCVLG